MELLKQPWPWYLSGILIGLMVPLLKVLGNKAFGISSSLRHICAAVLPNKIEFFNYDWRKESWNLMFVFGIVAGAFLANSYFVDQDSTYWSKESEALFASFGLSNFKGVLPVELFAVDNLWSVKIFAFTLFGGFLVGFGTRYANGCTSGHSINGLSHLDYSSLIATCSFMAGGFFSSHFIVPFLINLKV